MDRNDRRKRILAKKFSKKIKRMKNLLEKNKLEEEKKISKEKINCPSIFSISQNFIETLDVLEKIKKHSSVTRKKIILNMANVEKVDADALMYLKYIVYETKEIKKRNCMMTFIAPQNKDIKKFLYDSGFVTQSKYNKNIVAEKLNKKYWDKNNRIESQETENFKIRSGNTILLDEIKNIIDFSIKEIHDKAQIIVKDFLYNTIHELMENTISHAYLDKEKFLHKDWFLFAEKRHNIISFVFLDTGLGIPKTVAQKKIDGIYREFYSITSESDILLSTLKGEERTRTKEVNRGKGLPYIYQLSEKEIIKNLRIISNKACFNLNKNIDVKKHLQGTFLYWEIDINKYKKEVV